MGMAFLLSIEVLVNVAVAAGAVPATGMALPFFSAGGSSLLSTAISAGLIYNLSSSRSSKAGARGSDGASGFPLRGAGDV
jgi:cell division protein FtsW